MLLVPPGGEFPVLEGAEGCVGLISPKGDVIGKGLYAILGALGFSVCFREGSGDAFNIIFFFSFLFVFFFCYFYVFFFCFFFCFSVFRRIFSL